MATQGSLLTAEFDTYAAELIKAGRYADANEVLHAAVEALRREEADDEAKFVALEEALEAGFSSGIAEGDVLARIRVQYGLSAEGL